MIIGTYRKQPADERDIPVSFARYLEDLGDGDTIASATAVPDDVSLTVDTITHTDTVVSQWVRGGTAGRTYKVTVTATTVAGRVKEAEFRVRVKED